MFLKVSETAQYISDKIKNQKPTVAIILGSGLGELADEVENKIEINYTDIPNFHKTTVLGHAGRVVYGQIKNVNVIVFQGRFHAYEGHPIEDVVLPIRVIAKLGCRDVIITNASGGINTNYSPGELVCITDHINMTGMNPLIGTNDEEDGPRFPDMTEAYSRSLLETVNKAAEIEDIKLASGVYAGLLGPTYETPAEIKMLSVLGADLVGMSTVPEVIAANHIGLNVLAVSCVTNMAAGISKEKLSHEDVKVVAHKAIKKFKTLILKTVELIGN